MDDQHRLQLHRARMLDDGVYWQPNEGRLTTIAKWLGYAVGGAAVLLAIVGVVHAIGVISS